MKFKQFQQDVFKEENSENDFVLNNDEIAEYFVILLKELYLILL
jgi:hypothetical protein